MNKKTGMKCEKCGGEWIPPKGLSVSLTNCPFCGTPFLCAETAGSFSDMSDFLYYIVSLYGSEIYKDCRRLNNLISDLYHGDEQMKRVYRRAMLDDNLSFQVYELFLKPINERMAFYDKLTSHFTQVNFYSDEFGKKIVDSFVKGLKLEILPPVSTKATDKDGEWIDDFGVKYSADRKKLIKGNTNLTNYNIKEGTIAICDRAFEFCHSLANITIPSSVTCIGDSAFMHCDSLTSITIPASVTCIEDSAFAYCWTLIGITIPFSVVNIGNKAFYDCCSLTSINIPASVVSIGNRAFNHCSKLRLQVENNQHYFIENDILYEKKTNTLIWCPEYVKEVIVPSSVTCIGDSAFESCHSLTNITIPASVTCIEDSAFKGCSSLTSITIPSSVTNIGNSAFWGCDSLTSITIPASVTCIEDWTFGLCCSLASITIPASVTCIGDSAFGLCCSLTSITIPSSVTSIGDSAFECCYSLTSITIPSSVTSIGDSAFEYCDSLTSITIPMGSTEKFKKLLPSELHKYLKEAKYEN